MSRRISGRLATVLLPHDYLNFWLTGEKVMEYGDASGTALLDVRKRKWCEAALNAIDPELADKLPPLISSDQPAGRLQAATAKELGLEPRRARQRRRRRQHDGRHRHRQHPRRASSPPASAPAAPSTPARKNRSSIPQGEIAAFCDSTNRWLPLLCTMNVTVATEMVRADFGWTHEQFAEQSRPRSGRVRSGLLLLPYLEGERTPNVPDGTGVMLRGESRARLRAEHLARAAMEGVTLGMNYGLRRLARPRRQAHARSAPPAAGPSPRLWRQIMADVFNAEVVTLKVSEGAAYGAALQALWCWRMQQGENVSIKDDHRRVCRAQQGGNRRARRQERRSFTANCRSCRTSCPAPCAGSSSSTANSCSASRHFPSPAQQEPKVASVPNAQIFLHPGQIRGRWAGKNGCNSVARPRGDCAARFDPLPGVSGLNG